MLAFDLATILVVIASSFVSRTTLIEVIDVVIGVVPLAEFAARIAASRRPLERFSDGWNQPCA